MQDAHGVQPDLALVSDRGATPEPFVDMRHVKLMYGEETGTLALDDMSMTVGQGEFVSVVGPSGCGKSSLMKLVTGLLPVSSGTITVDGERVTEPLRMVGMAFQNPTLLPWRSTLENVLLPLEIVKRYRSQMRQDLAYHVDRAMALLSMVGLKGFADKQPWELSGGMQQRVNLCRSLIHEPSLLMLDEPFGALDAFTREELWGVLQKIWENRKFTCILVTHDLREAAYLSDKIVVMGPRPGRVIAEYKIELPRPRTLDMTFRPEFAAVVKEIREQINPAESLDADDEPHVLTPAERAV